MQNQFSRPSNVFEGSFELTIREVPVNSGKLYSRNCYFKLAFIVNYFHKSKLKSADKLIYLVGNVKVHLMANHHKVLSNFERG